MVIIGILAMVAIPRYFTNIIKSQKAQAWHNLNRMYEAYGTFYAANGSYPATSSWPIIVTVDGDAVMTLNNPANAIWTYGDNSNYADLYIIAYSTSKGYSACRLYKLTPSGTQYDLCAAGP